MKYLLLLFLTYSLCFSTVNQTEEVSVFSQNELEDKNIENKETNTNQTEEVFLQKEEKIQDGETNYYEEAFVDNLNKNDNKYLYLSYKTYPKFVYQKQTFEITLKVIVAKEEYDNIEIRFINSKDVTVLNPSSNWNEVQNQEYENKFYLKATTDTFVMPVIQILLYNDGELIEVEYLKKANIEFAKLASGNKRFSNVIANELKVTNYKTKQYNNKELLTVLEIYSLNGNLEDFILPNEYKEQGITSFDQSYPLQNLIYHAVIPIHTKKLSFNYYNALTNKFETINLPIVLENELVSTQTDLNPNNSSFEFYKKVAISILALFSLIITIWKRKVIFLIITLIIVIVLILFLMPNKTKILKKDVIIYILPTKNSTVFYKTKQEQLVQILNKKAGFFKVLFHVNNNKNEVIGWIKEDDVSKN